MKQTVYIPTPIEERPDDNGFYFVFLDDGRIGKIQCFGGEWIWTNDFVTHWLKPISVHVFTDEELQQVKDKEYKYGCGNHHA